MSLRVTNTCTGHHSTKLKGPATERAKKLGSRVHRDNKMESLQDFIEPFPFHFQTVAVAHLTATDVHLSDVMQVPLEGFSYI